MSHPPNGISIVSGDFLQGSRTWKADKQQTQTTLPVAPEVILDWYGGDIVKSGKGAEKTRRPRVSAGVGFWGRGSLPLTTSKGSGECCKLLQREPGKAPVARPYTCILRSPGGLFCPRLWFKHAWPCARHKFTYYYWPVCRRRRQTDRRTDATVTLRFPLYAATVSIR